MTQRFVVVLMLKIRNVLTLILHNFTINTAFHFCLATKLGKLERIHRRMQKVVSAFLQSGQALIFMCQREYYIGATHGLAGILCLLLQSDTITVTSQHTFPLTSVR